MKYIFAVLAAFSLLACSESKTNSNLEIQKSDPAFYSKAGREFMIKFTAVYRTKYSDLSQVQNLGSESKRQISDVAIVKTIKYLFGVMTYQDIGGPKRDGTAVVDWSTAVLNPESGKVEVTYSYTGHWLLAPVEDSGLELALPMNEEAPFTPLWEKCYIEGQSEGFSRDIFWYHWDPKMDECDQVLGRDYQTIRVELLEETKMTEKSYPEYSQIIRTNNIENNLVMTVAFGYTVDLASPLPFEDKDEGMEEFRSYLKAVRKLHGLKWTETPILQSEYLAASNPTLQIGVRFQAVANGVNVTLNAVSNAGITQMDLFAKSYAHDHDSIFAWFGHSHLGNGFAPSEFQGMLASNPSYYSLSPNYQILYFGSCNSYSYYAHPFFKMKARLNPSLDPNGSKFLDILSNGVQTFFQRDAANAVYFTDTMLHWEEKTSYQEIVDTLQKKSKVSFNSVPVLFNVLGDEDNQLPQ